MEEHKDSDAAPRRKRVFFSYAHESDEHKNSVLKLCEQFRTSGLDAQLDQYEQFPVQGWPQWMLHQIKQAEYVLVVCSKAYLERFEGTAPPGAGKGAKWEGAIISLGLYESEGSNKKFIPIIVQPSDKEFIPSALKPFTHFDVSTSEGQESLYRLLTDQPYVVPSAIGGISELPPKPITSDVSSKASRVKADIKFTTTSAGWVPLLNVVNISDIPLYLENPHLILELDPVADEPQESLEVSLLPTKPVSGPLLPTQKRTYFLHPNTLELIKHDPKFFGVSTPTIRIATPVGDELLINDATSVGTLKSILGFPDTGETDYYRVRMPLVTGLVHKRCTDQAHTGFKVYAPREMVDDPSIIERDDVVEILKDKPFQIAFEDDTSAVVSLAELMAFQYQLIFVKLEMEKIEARFKESGMPDAAVNITTNINTRMLMEPEVVQLSLSKFGFEPTPFVPEKPPQSDIEGAT